MVVDHDLLENRRIDHVKSTGSALVFVSFHAPQIPQDLEFLLYNTNIFHFVVVCSVIQYLYLYNVDVQMMSECGKNISDPLL